MSGEPFEARAERLRADHEDKARAELAAADALAPGSDVVAWSGAPIAGIALVKGLPGPSEAAGGEALSGPDGVAAAKALEALGWSAAATFRTLSRPDPSIPAESRASRLRAQIEAVDARVVVALDAEAAEDLARAFGVRRLVAGREVEVAGRRLTAVDGLEASLPNQTRKRRVWNQFKTARPDGPVYRS